MFYKLILIKFGNIREVKIFLKICKAIKFILILQFQNTGQNDFHVGNVHVNMFCSNPPLTDFKVT